jgi:hypothetical protein
MKRQLNVSQARPLRTRYYLQNYQQRKQLKIRKHDS